MLTRARFSWVFLFSALLLIGACVPIGAQIHGVPPSVTSFGFGGSNNPTPGVPASVTSLGPRGYGGGGCCFGPFISPFHGRDFDHQKFHNHLRFPVGEVTPAYIPYFVPYPVPNDQYAGDENNADVDPTYSRGAPPVYERGPWYGQASERRQGLAETPLARKEAEPAAVTAAAAAEAPVATAPRVATVLVYKDGRKVEVQNYAIAGDTLYDFTGNLSHKVKLADLDLEATRKANEDRGVDFQIPGEKEAAR
jgi:hypothetical protein